MEIDGIRFKPYMGTKEYQVVEEKHDPYEFYIMSVSKDSAPLIGGFKTAAEAISFAENRVRKS